MVELLADGISTGTVFASIDTQPYHDCAEIEATGAVLYQESKQKFCERDRRDVN